MSNSKKSKIIKHLNISKNSRLRETIFKYAFFHDIKLAATTFKSNLKIYEPEVDNEGCDIIVEDGLDFSRKIQLKSIYHSTTKQWNIHKSILLPAFSQMSDYGLDSIICPSNPGGVILIDAREKFLDDKKENTSTHESDYPQNNYRYLYTDINIIYLIFLGVVKSNLKSKENARKVISKIRDQSHFNKIIVPRNLFVEVKGPLALIKLIGICGMNDFIINSHKYIRIQINKAGFFKSLGNYNPYETSPNVIKQRNKLLEEETRISKQAINDELMRLTK